MTTSTIMNTRPAFDQFVADVVAEYRAAERRAKEYCLAEESASLRMRHAKLNTAENVDCDRYEQVERAANDAKAAADKLARERKDAAISAAQDEAVRKLGPIVSVLEELGATVLFAAAAITVSAHQAFDQFVGEVMAEYRAVERKAKEYCSAAEAASFRVQHAKLETAKNADYEQYLEVESWANTVRANADARAQADKRSAISAARDEALWKLGPVVSALEELGVTVLFAAE